MLCAPRARLYSHQVWDFQFSSTDQQVHDFVAVYTPTSGTLFSNIIIESPAGTLNFKFLMPIYMFEYMNINICRFIFNKM